MLPTSQLCHAAAAARIRPSFIRSSAPDRCGVGLRPPTPPRAASACEFSLVDILIDRVGGTVPLSVRLLQRRNKFAGAPRPRSASPELGAAGSAVASLAAALEAVQGAAACGFTPPPKRRSEAGDAVVWIFRKVFVSSPSLAVALLGLVSQFLAMSVQRELFKERVEERKNAPSAPDAGSSGNQAIALSPSIVRLRCSYEKTIADGSANSLVLSNYAQFLYEFWKDIDRAEKYFIKAAHSGEDDGEAMKRYAMFLWLERGELERAEEMFQEAMAAEPRCDHHKNCYAWFLWMTGGDGTCLLNYFSN